MLHDLPPIPAVLRLISQMTPENRNRLMAILEGSPQLTGHFVLLPREHFEIFPEPAPRPDKQVFRLCKRSRPPWPLCQQKAVNERGAESPDRRAP